MSPGATDRSLGLSAEWSFVNSLFQPHRCSISYMYISFHVLDSQTVDYILHFSGTSTTLTPTAGILKVSPTFKWTGKSRCHVVTHLVVLIFNNNQSSVAAVSSPHLVLCMYNRRVRLIFVLKFNTPANISYRQTTQWFEFGHMKDK